MIPMPWLGATVFVALFPVLSYYAGLLVGYFLAPRYAARLIVVAALAHPGDPAAAYLFCEAEFERLTAPVFAPAAFRYAQRERGCRLAMAHFWEVQLKADRDKVSEAVRTHYTRMLFGSPENKE